MSHGQVFQRDSIDDADLLAIDFDQIVDCQFAQGTLDNILHSA